MTGIEIAICVAVILVGVAFALVIDSYERKLERARYELARTTRPISVELSIGSREIARSIRRDIRGDQ